MIVILLYPLKERGNQKFLLVALKEVLKKEVFNEKKMSLLSFNEKSVKIMTESSLKGAREDETFTITGDYSPVGSYARR